LRTRRGGDDAHLRHARPDAQGPRRARRRVQDGVGAPSRSLRLGAGCEDRAQDRGEDRLGRRIADGAAKAVVVPLSWCRRSDMREACLSATGWLGLAAAPTFAIMALATSAGGGAADMLCAGSSPLAGMTAMYLLMSAFHLPPWLRLIGAGRA